MTTCDICNVHIVDPHRSRCRKCDGTEVPEPRITPAMVRRLHDALQRAHGYVARQVIEAWAARENKRGAK